MCTFLLQNAALWDMAQMHSGICEMGLLGGDELTAFGSNFGNHEVTCLLSLCIYSSICTNTQCCLVFIHIHQGCFAGTGAIVRLPQCQWSKPDGYGKISQCITTTKHSKAKTVCIFLGIYCTRRISHQNSKHNTCLVLIIEYRGTSYQIKTQLQ